LNTQWLGIEQYNVETPLQKSTTGWLPYALGALLVALFAGLGVWQISRALEKRAAQEAFDRQTGFTRFVDGMDVRPFQRLAAEGVFDTDHQFLLDNIIVDSRNGHYVLTPLVYSTDEPVLIVNRGWVERAGDAMDASALELPDGRLTVRGRVGALPQAGFRMGPAIESASTWPQHAVYPTLDELAASLGREVQPFVLLMAPGEDHGLLRRWEPTEIGPARHYAYAFQWFAMAFVLAALLAWNFHRRGLAR
jgi:surfeit locus 1 family protein